jgi:aspartokinase/homoserine dehydrogenase 1
MKVMKFGGTSVGSPEGLRLVKDIIESQIDTAIVVVSAFSGVTDKLLLAADFALNNNISYKTILEEVIVSHKDIISKVINSEVDRQDVAQRRTAF